MACDDPYCGGGGVLSMLKEKLTKINPCPEAWNDRDGSKYPKAEMGYLRCDHDGSRWWNTVWRVHRELETPELMSELDAVLF